MHVVDYVIIFTYVEVRATVAVGVVAAYFFHKVGATMILRGDASHPMMLVSCTYEGWPIHHCLHW